MVNFHDPFVVLQDNLVLLKLDHLLSGIYMWEFFTTLDYEWGVIRGRLPYRWTILPYAFTRLGTLITMIIIISLLDLKTRTNCQLWATFSFIFAYITFASSSLLIMLRVIAIWNKTKIIVGLVTTVWGINVTFLIYGKSLPASPAHELKYCQTWLVIRSAGSNQVLGSCSELNVKSNTPTFISMVITDFILLILMLVGLLRIRYGDARMFALSRLLWTQGVIWLFLATLAEVPPVVFNFLNLNDPFNLMFLLPGLITMSIAATRMYRTLADFLCSTDIVYSDNPPRIGLTIPNAISTFTVPTPPGQLEDMAHEMYSLSLPGTDENNNNISCVSSDYPGLAAV